MRKLLLLSVALLGLTASANAATIAIGASVDGGTTITTLQSNQLGVVDTTSGFGGYLINASGTGNPPLPNPFVLDSTAISIKPLATGLTSPLSLYISLTDVTMAGLAAWNSAFAAVTVSPGSTLTESTYLSSSNALYATTTPLGSTTFSSIGAIAQTALASCGVTCSVTELFFFTPNFNLSGESGAVNGNIDLQVAQVPLPPALALFGAGLAGIGWITRRRKRNVA